MDCSLPGFPVHRTSWERTLEWVAIRFIVEILFTPLLCLLKPQSYLQLTTWFLLYLSRLLKMPCAVLSCFSRVQLCNPMDCSLPGSSVHGDSPGKNTAVGGHAHALFHGIFPTQRSNPGLPHCMWILYHLSHQRSLLFFPSVCPDLNSKQLKIQKWVLGNIQYFVVFF